MITAIVAAVVSFLAGLVAGALLMALACAAGNEGGYVAISPDVDEDPELTALRHQLAVCQETAEKQRQRADTYYDLYCQGAKANAELRRTL